MYFINIRSSHIYFIQLFLYFEFSTALHCISLMQMTLKLKGRKLLFMSFRPNKECILVTVFFLCVALCTGCFFCLFVCFVWSSKLNYY